MAWRVLILGGGFGGLYTARTLEKVLPSQSTRITLINDVNFMLYTPLLPGAAAGTLEPRHVVVPLRDQLRHTDLRLGTVTGADPDRRVVNVTFVNGAEAELRYDQLVVSLGSISRTLPVPGLSEHAVGFKTLPDAIALHNRVLQSMEIAETLEDPDERRAWLTYVFVGAGYAGLEGLAELQDLAVDAIERYPRCRIQGMRWILVEARERVMYEISPDLGGFASDQLRARGIEIRTSTVVEEVAEDFVRLAPAADVGPPGETVPCRTVAWTTGVRPHPAVAHLGLPLTDTGRIQVDEYMQVAGHSDVWAIGDAAAVPDPARSGQPCPPTCQHAIRQGRTVARNVAAALGTGRRRKFSYKTLGVFVDMGRRKAVAETVGIKWRGFPAWFLARTYHLAMMPGVARKLRLTIDWTVGLAFGRDVAEVGQLGPPRLGDGEAPAGAVRVGARAGSPPGPDT